MSRVGKQPINIPEDVQVTLSGVQVIVTGPKGTLKQTIRPEINLIIKDKQLLITVRQNNDLVKSIHGLTRSLVANMIIGVTSGFQKELELQGTGYRVALEGENLKLNVGFSHPVIIKPSLGIKFMVEGTNIIKVTGADKQLVGQTAINIKNIKPPEPYKGKGIRFKGEKIIHKAGKAAKTGSATG